MPRIVRISALVLLLAAAVWIVLTREDPGRGARSAARTSPADTEPAHRAELAPPATVAAEPSSAAAPGTGREVRASTPAPQPSAAVPEHGQVLSGIVRDESGAPVETFVVHWRDGAKPYSSLESRAVTDPLGFFSLDGLGMASARVHVESEGHAPTEAQLVELPTGEVLEFVLLRPAELTVTVSDARGVRLAGPEVEVRQRQDERMTVLRRERIPESGSLTVTCRPGEVLLQARAQGHAPSEARVVALRSGEVAQVELVLRRPGAILGEVRDAHGNALAHLPVGIYPRDDSDEEVRTDLDGSFRFDGLAPDVYTLGTRLPDGQDLHQLVRLEEGGEARVTLAAKGNASLRVSGRVLVEAGVFRFGNVFFLGEDRASTASAVIRDDRTFEVNLEHAGLYRVQLVGSGNGGFQWTTQVEIPEQAEVELDLEPPLALVRGQVQDEQGRPLPSVAVRAETAGPGRGSYTLTDAEGRYELYVVAGSFTLVAGGPQAVEWGTEGRAPGRIRGLAVQAGEVLAELDFRLARGARLQGRARFESGAPAAEVGILGLAAGEWRSLGSTGEDGRFDLIGVDPAVTRVRVRARTGKSPEVPVVLRVDETSTVELVLPPP